MNTVKFKDGSKGIDLGDNVYLRLKNNLGELRFDIARGWLEDVSCTPLDDPYCHMFTSLMDIQSLVADGRKFREIQRLLKEKR